MAHDHAHDHGHDHHHHGGASYYYEQLFTIAGCGALALVTLLMCYFGQVRWILAGYLQPVLAAGGLGLLALVVIRAVALWTSVEEPHAHPAHDHDHSHDHDHAHEHHDGCAHHHHHDHSHQHGDGHVHHAGCDHGHEHKHETAVKGADATAGLHVGTELLKQTAPAAAAAAAPAPAPADDNHDHDHDHNHGWAPLRFVVLFVPVALYALNLPNSTFAADKGLDQNGFQVIGSSSGKREAIQLTFSQFEHAARLDEETRTRDYEGKTVTLVGQFWGENESQFTLIRYKINCCAADAQPLNAAMRVDYSQLPGKYAKLDYRNMRNRWVEVTGQIRFMQKGSQVISALIVEPTEPNGPDSLASLIRVLDRPPDNPYVN